MGQRAAGRRRIPALKVAAIDMVGAGDAFNAGLAVGLADGRPVVEAILPGRRRRISFDGKTRDHLVYPRRLDVDRRLEEVLAAAERGRSA